MWLWLDLVRISENQVLLQGWSWGLDFQLCQLDENTQLENFFKHTHLGLHIHINWYVWTGSHCQVLHPAMSTHTANAHATHLRSQIHFPHLCVSLFPSSSILSAFQQQYLRPLRHKRKCKNRLAYKTKRLLFSRFYFLVLHIN